MDLRSFRATVATIVPSNRQSILTAAQETAIFINCRYSNVIFYLNGFVLITYAQAGVNVYIYQRL